MLIRHQHGAGRAAEEAGDRDRRKKIALAEPIKQLGEYTVGIKVHPEVVANLKVNVTKSE